MVASISSASIAASILAATNTNSGGIDFTMLFAGASGSSGGQVYNAASAAGALANAEKNEDKQLADTAKQPDVQRDLARYAKVVKNAKSLDDVLNDPIARKVLLKANGLGDQADYVGLAKKALGSLAGDTNSVAYKLSSVNGNWLNMVNKYNFGLVGVGVLQVSDAVKEVSDNYVAEKRLDMLDQQLPGLGTAVLFQDVAKDLDSPVKILGSAVGREVVTTALGLPKQLALQSEVAQEKAISQRIDPTKLADPAFANKIATRYLIMLNGGTTGVTA